MSRFLRYFLKGTRNSIVLGVPDFQTNNQFEDMQNISNDFKISYNRIISNASRKSHTKTKRLRTKR